MLRVPAKAERKTKATASRQPTFVGQYLEVNPRVCHGQLIFRGTRVPVDTVLVRLAKGRTIASLRKSWPEVSSEAIAEAVTLATDLLVQHCQTKQACSCPGWR
jgi:uncharacterized protein (DUF433 family)